VLARALSIHKTGCPALLAFVARGRGVLADIAAADRVLAQPSDLKYLQVPRSSFAWAGMRWLANSIWSSPTNLLAKSARKTDTSLCGETRASRHVRGHGVPPTSRSPYNVETFFAHLDISNTH